MSGSFEPAKFSNIHRHVKSKVDQFLTGDKGGAFLCLGEVR